MSAGERVMIEVNGRMVKALRIWLRHDPTATPAGQPTVPPRRYSEVPADLSVAISDVIQDLEEESTVSVTYIRRPRKASGLAKELILECG